MRLLPMLAAVATLSAPVSMAQSLKSNEIYSSISIEIISEPNPVAGADGRVHLAYELLVVNPSKIFMTVAKVEAVDERGKSLAAMQGDALAAMTERFSGAGNMLAPGCSAVMFMDVSFAAGETLPSTVSARITASRQIAGPDGKPAGFPASEPLPATITFTGKPTTIGQQAVVVESPLRGPGWVAVNGCCDAITSHRGALMTVNGRIRVPERFAIDWLQLDSAGRVFSGDGSKLSSFAYYGAPIHAAADGVVVNLYDGADEQVPNAPAKGITTENIGGNMIVIDIGGGAYAFYAHMQRGSLKVNLGDRVKTGDVIGLLGNTGNTTAPHLHFHVMDGPSPLNANGLPFVLKTFSSRGVLAPGSDDIIEAGNPAKIDPRLAGKHANQLPLNDEIVDFD